MIYTLILTKIILMEFTGNNFFQGMKMILVSDCYIGFEQEYNIEEFA